MLPGPRLRPRAALGQPALNGRALFVVVPGCNQQEGHRTSSGVLPPQLHRVCKGLATALRNVPIETPRGFAVIETRPGCPPWHLVGIFRLHFAIEVGQVILSPVAAICCKAFFPWVYPCVETAERSCGGTGLVFIDEQGGMGPFIGGCPNSVPIGMPSFRENENNRPSVVREVSLMARCSWRKIGFVELVKRGKSIVGRLGLFFLGFVIHHRNVEVFFGGDGLDQGVAAIKKGLTIAVPVDHEPRNSQSLGLINLLADHNRIMRGIANRNVPGMTNPGLIARQSSWRSLGTGHTRLQFLAQTRMRARLRQHENNQCANHPVTILHRRSVLRGPASTLGCSEPRNSRSLRRRASSLIAGLRIRRAASRAESIP